MTKLKLMDWCTIF